MQIRSVAIFVVLFTLSVCATAEKAQEKLIEKNARQTHAIQLTGVASQSLGKVIVLSTSRVCQSAQKAAEARCSASCGESGMQGFTGATCGVGGACVCNVADQAGPVE